MPIKATFMLTLFAATQCWSQSPSLHVPEEIRHCLTASGLRQKFEVIGALNPFYLRGDFDGDGSVEPAILIKNRSSSKEGILVCLQDGSAAKVLGASTQFHLASGSVDDLKFEDWEVRTELRAVPKPTAEEDWLLKSRSDKILLIWRGASGLVYWRGNQFRYYVVDE